jgi:DNA polymerase III epsilon subunit-like protein
MASLVNLQDHNNHFLMREIVIDTETTGLDPLDDPTVSRALAE